MKSIVIGTSTKVAEAVFDAILDAEVRLRRDLKNILGITNICEGAKGRPLQRKESLRENYTSSNDSVSKYAGTVRH